MKPPKGQDGLTLIELIVVVVLVGVLAAMAVPGWSGLVTSSHKHAAVSELVTLINLARNTAIQEQISVTLCPLDTSGACSHDWNQPITVFRDPARKRVLERQNQVIRVAMSQAHGRLIVKSAHRRYFGFRPSGHAREAIGNILWCPPDNDPGKASQIRINMGGRPILARDTSGDGIVEGADGAPVSCS